MVLGVLLVAFPPGNLRAADSPMEKSMEKMEDAKKALFPALKQPVAADKDKYVALAKTLKTEGEASRELDPEIAAKLPPDQKDRIVTAYRKDMDEFIKTSQALVEALEKEQWTEARALVAKLKEQEKAGHKAYRKKKEKGGGPGGSAGAPPPPQ